MLVFRRKYGVTLDTSTAGSLKVRVAIRKALSPDFATSSDWTPATNDVKVAKDFGAEANIGTLPSYSNGAWEFVLTGTELSAKLVTVKVVDSATKAVDDFAFAIETVGSTSAMWATDYTKQQLGIVTEGNTAFVDSDGRMDAGYITGFLQTPRDLGAALPDSAPGEDGGLATVDANGNVPANVLAINDDLTPAAKIAAYWLRVLSGTAQAGAASTITLATGSSSTDNFYQGWTVHLVNGTGNSQTRTIVSYVGSTKVATVDRAWTTNPTSSTDYLLKPPPSSPYTAAMFAALMNQTAFNIAQAGSSTTITLASSESSTDDAFKDAWVYISSGTGAKQKPQQISGYVGSTKVATISGTWQTTPDSTSVYQIIR